MPMRQLARNPANHGYELGWREGWAAALTAVERAGSTAHVRAAGVPVPLTLEHPCDPETPQNGGTSSKASATGDSSEQ